MGRGVFDFFRSKTTVNPASADLEAMLGRARDLQQQGRHADAATLCQEILARQPTHVGVLFLSAELATATGDPERAMQVYRHVLDLKPDHAPAYYKIGNLLKDRRQLEAAAASYDAAIARDPGYAYAYCNRGFVLERLGRWETALASYDHAIALTPGDALAHYNRAGVLRVLARPEEALTGYAQAIAAKPDYFEAYCNRGHLLTELNRWEAALESHTKCLEINPGFAPGHSGRGAALQKLKQWDAALASYDRAIAIDPLCAEAHCNRGSLLTDLKRWREARSSLERALALDPDSTEAHCSLGVLMADMGQAELAVTHFDRAIALKPDYADAHLNRANSLLQLRRIVPAIAGYERGVALKPTARSALGMLHYAKMGICDWSDSSSEVNRLVRGIEAGEAVSPPLPILAMVDSAELHDRIARIWVQTEYPAAPELSAIPQRPRRAKARIGYFSGDFHNHPVAVLMAEVFELHDRSTFEVVAFSYGPDTQDDMRRRLQGVFDRFIDVRGKSDRDIALLAREMEIDVAVDLAGHTAGARTGIFALRAAPLQVNYLGYPGTMGASYMDYLIGDRTVVPAESEPHYAEKIVRLPNSFLPNDSRRAIAEKTLSRGELGLPAAGFVFCCFNNNYKITPQVFDGWMRILARVPNSVLWLSQNSELAAENLRREASLRGVGAERLIFAARMPSPAEHLARQRAADLFLDTRPYNAHATAIDALWAGLPVLTLPGDGFASRVAASLLQAVHVPELITTSAEDYEDMAVRLAHDARLLASIRTTLARNRLEAPLFDTRRFARDLESAYGLILDRYHAGLPPEPVDLTADARAGAGP